MKSYRQQKGLETEQWGANMILVKQVFVLGGVAEKKQPHTR